MDGSSVSLTPLQRMEIRLPGTVNSGPTLINSC